LRCKAGYKDCKNGADDGCESDISSEANCGDCNVRCSLDQNCLPDVDGNYTCQ